MAKRDVLARLEQAADYKYTSPFAAELFRASIARIEEQGKLFDTQRKLYEASVKKAEALRKIYARLRHTLATSKARSDRVDIENKQLVRENNWMAATIGDREVDAMREAMMGGADDG